MATLRGGRGCHEVRLDWECFNYVITERMLWQEIEGDSGTYKGEIVSPLIILNKTKGKSLSKETKYIRASFNFTDTSKETVRLFSQIRRVLRRSERVGTKNAFKIRHCSQSTNTVILLPFQFPSSVYSVSQSKHCSDYMYLKLHLKREKQQS